MATIYLVECNFIIKQIAHYELPEQYEVAKFNPINSVISNPDEKTTHLTVEKITYKLRYKYNDIGYYYRE